MNLAYDLSDVFVLAERMEHNAAAFYNAAAKTVEDEATSSLLASLALEERAHEVIFEGMKRDSGANKGDVTDPENVVSHYLQNIADRWVFSGGIDHEELLPGNCSVRDILMLAMESERDSINTYIWLRGAMSEAREQMVVEKLIGEEQGHLSKLRAMLGKLN